MAEITDDLTLLCNELDSLITGLELNQGAIDERLAKLDALLLENSVTLGVEQPDNLKLAYERYLTWVEKFIDTCNSEKQRLADELVLLQRRKNAKEQYQR